MPDPKIQKNGDWSTAVFDGGVNATQGDVMTFLSKQSKATAETAKVFQGTDQTGKPVCAIIYKE